MLEEIDVAELMDHPFPFRCCFRIRFYLPSHFGSWQLYLVLLALFFFSFSFVLVDSIIVKLAFCFIFLA